MTLELHPLNRASIQQELELVLQEYPWFARVLHQAMRDGVLIDTPFVGDNGDCGCFYGHLAGLDQHNAFHLQRHFRGLLDIDDGFIYTPIEFLLLSKGVDQGATPETNETLAFLDELLVPYLEEQKESIPWT